MTGSGGVRALVDHDFCAGVAECLRQAPGAFQIDADGFTVFAPSAPWTVDELTAARDSCPMTAITIVPGNDDAEGQ
jgi:ferredoxin